MKILTILLVLWLCHQYPFQRVWKLSEFDIHASDGIPDGKPIQHLIDSALNLRGDTELRMDECGDYCTNDTGLVFNYVDKIGRPYITLWQTDCPPCRDYSYLIHLGHCDRLQPKKPF